ncbi:6,7-dimethyl-8-ribityllumazine synthase [Allomyces macrogynus ATCC 38327]|uniref:6,7-dimethyl-8-ribityllumazine synthase n=1 Tax=Allomyces macrogynus (strain ATCC 38327) TaxID=578462 RepID=A0A0L0SN94_ALLM3|nr:6,7-dimethyl-8-ribityllumazine synthase [Allomyces macrogynus ATCC 38327]|eukprot:KNE63991.1 6,7-dimethyl-8-ribityllumazine synthase [Allomyces macrogynus ATCC 38327]
MLDKAKTLTHGAYDAAAASALKILVIHTRWNVEIVSALRDGVLSSLTNQYAIPRSNIDVVEVPGAFELPFATKALLKQGKYDAVIPIGVLIKGATVHFEYISEAATHALMNVGLESGTPVIFGILTCLTEEQALQRAGIGRGEEKGHNHGIDWAAAAVEMALLNQGKARKH